MVSFMIFKFRALIALFVMSVMAAMPGIALAQNALGAQELNIKATLVAESQQVHAGETVTLAFVMKPKPTWHGYWENPGDAGIGMSFEWQLPTGVTAEQPQFQTPDRLLISGIMNYIYKGDYAVLVNLTLAENVKPGALPIKVNSNWLACTDEICVPEQDEFTITLNVVDKNTPLKADPTFNRYREALPRPLGNDANFAVNGDIFRISIPLPADVALDEPYFFIKDDGVIDYGAEQKISRDGDRLIIETAARGDPLEMISGILRIGPKNGLFLTASKGEVQASGGGGNFTGGDGQSKTSLLLLSLAGAIIGGLLLNLMPCVFPILSLKAISLAKAGGEEATVRRDALAYTAGIITVATALGATILALRAGGEAVGWAFQLQDPRIIFILLALVTAIAFNLAGLFELPNMSVGNQLTQKSGMAGSFWTGALAAFVATPCTGPFMGYALGATIILPPLAALLIFAGLGIGLALPFLLIAYVPAIRNRLPKPGPWLDNFRKAMAVPMFLTALALIWLLGRQIGANGLSLSLLFILLISMLLWWLGGGQMKGRSRGAITAVAAIAALIGGIITLPDANAIAAQKLAEKSISSDEIVPGEPFSQARLAELRASGRPIFAYFTADWCITCKANEATAIQRSETAEAFAAANVAVLVGDWTRPDPEINKFLNQHGRAGVPLYLYFPPGKDAMTLPQILTVSTLTELVAQQAKGEKAS